LPKDFRKRFGGQFNGGFHAAMCDGSVRFVPDKVTDRTLGFALCPDDGQVLGSDW
jgi:prepilin-type processing-associated H-X9-DG protein